MRFMRVLSRLLCENKAPINGNIILSEMDYPALYRAANASAIASQNKFFFLLATELSLLVLAAFLSFLNSTSVGIAILQSGILLVVLGCVIFSFYDKPDRHWYAARAVAESVKTITWRYATRAEPFNVSDEDAREIFRQRLQQVLEQNRDTTSRFRAALDGVQITKALEDLRGASGEDRKRAYVEGRISDQQRWYASKSSYNDCVGKRFFVVLMATVFIAVIFSLCRIHYHEFSIWPTEIFVTTASVMLTWIQSKRFFELAASYAVAANEISLIQMQAANSMDDGALSKFIGDAENAFSREHTQWVARKDV